MNVTHSPTRVQYAGILALLWLTGLYLRLPVLIAPPLAPFIADDLGLSQTGIGALTTIPVLMLAAGALPGSLAISRLGARRTLVLALGLVVIASAARGLAPPALLLFTATVLMGLGIAAMQPALPALVPLWSPTRVALGSAVYMNGMLMGEFIGGGLTLPIVMPATGGDWRLALVIWSTPGLALAGALLLPQRRRPDDDGTADRGWHPDWHGAQVWQLGLLLGAAASMFFGTNAYMASVLRARGAEASLPATLLLFNLSQVLASLTVVAASRFLIARRWPFLTATLLGSVSLVGFLALGGVAAMICAVVVGFCTAIQMILLVSLPPLIKTPRHAGRLAAGMFTLGYLIAFTVPTLGGVLADTVGNPSLALVPVILYAAPTAIAAWRLELR